MPGLIDLTSESKSLLTPIDFSQYARGTPDEQNSCRLQIVDSLTQLGYARMVNVGIENKTIDKIFDLSSRFFALPIQAKSAIANPRGPNPQRGWSHIGAEKSSALYSKLIGRVENIDLSDAREHFDQGPETDEKFPNRWPSADELPEFRPFMQDFFKASEAVSFQILQALEEALGLPPKTFRSCVRNASELRLNHYPSITLQKMREGSVNRIWPHFDLGVMTLLWTRGAGGLEFQDREHKDSFISVEPESPYELILSTSETLQRWTDDVLPAALHQVTIPQHLKSATDGEIAERFSVAYFCKADRDAMVGTMAPFIDPLHGPRYPNMTALEYHQTRLKAAY